MKNNEKTTLQNKSCEVILATKQWIDEVIIGLNFCPFAKKEFVNNTIFYHSSESDQIKPALHEIIEQCRYLQDNNEIETTLIVYNNGFRTFERYLDLVDYANDLLAESGFEGTFQIATMHPEYCFEGEDYDNSSNYTNRSPFPVIHIIREASMSRVLAVYNEPEKIPENNIALAEDKGANYFQKILQNIHVKYPLK